MRLLKITTLYPDYLKNFYSRRPGLAEKSFSEQKAALDYDASGWADFWSRAMEPLGYEMLELTINAAPLQQAWAAENGRASVDPDRITVEQVRCFRPDILWYDHVDVELLRRIREAVPSIRLTLGWVGSAIPRTDVWRHMDLVLSCAPESVETLRDAGFRTAHLHHGFDPRINVRLHRGPKRFDCSFIGQVVRSGGVHRQREQLLEAIAVKTGIEIFSPSAGFTRRDDLKALLKSGIYRGARALKNTGLSDSVIHGIPLFGKAAQWPGEPARPVSRLLRGHFRPPVFGIDMFQVLLDSKASLNIHADSSPRFASNMRLFETTGVGACLVSEWKENLHELFVPDTEVVVYRNAEECTEKIRWLVDHPRETERIAAAGMARTLREHTFDHRALALDRIIRAELK